LCGFVAANIVILNLPPPLVGAYSNSCQEMQFMLWNERHKQKVNVLFRNCY
jgi:hypothetical protein